MEALYLSFYIFVIFGHTTLIAEAGLLDPLRNIFNPITSYPQKRQQFLSPFRDNNQDYENPNYEPNSSKAQNPLGISFSIGNPNNYNSPSGTSNSQLPSDGQNDSGAPGNAQVPSEGQNDSDGPQDGSDGSQLPSDDENDSDSPDEGSGNVQSPSQGHSNPIFSFGFGPSKSQKPSEDQNDSGSSVGGSGNAQGPSEDQNESELPVGGSSNSQLPSQSQPTTGFPSSSSNAGLPLSASGNTGLPLGGSSSGMPFGSSSSSGLPFGGSSNSGLPMGAASNSGSTFGGLSNSKLPPGDRGNQFSSVPNQSRLLAEASNVGVANNSKMPIKGQINSRLLGNRPDNSKLPVNRYNIQKLPDSSSKNLDNSRLIIGNSRKGFKPIHKVKPHVKYLLDPINHPKIPDTFPERTNVHAPKKIIIYEPENTIDLTPPSLNNIKQDNRQLAPEYPNKLNSQKISWPSVKDLVPQTTEESNITTGTTQLDSDDAPDYDQYLAKRFPQAAKLLEELKRLDQIKAKDEKYFKDARGNRKHTKQKVYANADIFELLKPEGMGTKYTTPDIINGKYVMRKLTKRKFYYQAQPVRPVDENRSSNETVYYIN